MVQYVTKKNQLTVALQSILQQFVTKNNEKKENLFTWCGDCAGWGGCGDGLGACPGLWGGPCCCGDGGGWGWPIGPGLAAGDGPPGAHCLVGSAYYK